MSTAEIFAAIAAVGGAGGVYTVLDGVRKRIAAKAQGDIAVSSAVSLLKPLQERVDELSQECKELRTQVKDLSAEVEHQRQVINVTTVKLESANRRADDATQRADLYQRAFETRTRTEGAT